MRERECVRETKQQRREEREKIQAAALVFLWRCLWFKRVKERFHADGELATTDERASQRIDIPTNDDLTNVHVHVLFILCFSLFQSSSC